MSGVSLPPQSRKPMTLRGACGNPLTGAGVLLRSKAMTILTISVIVVVVADVGTQDVMLYYLNDRIGFNGQDNAFFFVEMALMSLIGNLAITPLMLRYVSTITVLCVAVLSNAVLLVLIATAWAPWGIFAFVAPLYGLLVMATPLLNTMITNIGHERDVGKRITAMTAVSDFCNALGPLIFGLLYGALPRELMVLPFIVFAALIVCVVALQWFRLGSAIRDDQAKVQEELRQEAVERGDDPDAVTDTSPAHALYHGEDCA